MKMYIMETNYELQVKIYMLTTLGINELFTVTEHFSVVESVVTVYSFVYIRAISRSVFIITHHCYVIIGVDRGFCIIIHVV